MDITIDTGAIGVTLDNFAHSVGETTEQATLRYGVAAARSLSKATPPKVTRKGALLKKTKAHMRRVVEGVPSRYFNRLRSGKSQSVQRGGRWYRIRPHQILSDPQSIWDAIEANRSGGKTRDLPAGEKYVCSRANFNRVARSRARLWGVGKGSWLGAGRRIASLQRGLDRNTIGKNHPAMAKRHMDKGYGLKLGAKDNTTVKLVSKASASDGLSNSKIELALKIARKAVFAYYRGAFRRIHPTGKRR